MSAMPNTLNGSGVPKKPCLSAATSQASAGLDPAAVSLAVARALDQARDERGVPLSREQVAERMGTPDRKITVAILSDWAAASKVHHQIPLHLVDDLQRATNSYELWAAIRAALAPAEEIQEAQIGRLYLERRRASRVLHEMSEGVA